MKVHLVNYEASFNNGILTKFATRLEEELTKLGLKVSVSNKPNPKADWNHHINYLPYKPNKTKNSLMITHIWEGYKLESVKEGMKTADIGICMSKDTEDYLKKHKIPKKKLATVLPAHDNLPRRRKTVCILTNVYSDGCKREWMFPELLKKIDLDKFHFLIMGSGWEDTLNQCQVGHITYYGPFDYDRHLQLLEVCDYSLYFGLDEGSMGILDAKHCGQQIIAPPIGFNKDMGIDYPFISVNELVAVFKKLGENKVDDWTWENYAKQHLEIWKKLS